MLNPPLTLLLSAIVAGAATAQPLFREYSERPFPQRNEFMPVTAFDANGDGTVDLVFTRNRTSSAEPGLTVLFNEGSGVFGAEVLTAVGSGIGQRSLAPADLDGDGDIDLVTTDMTRILLNDGQGAFTPTPTGIPFPGLITDALVGDLDGDGDVDVASPGETSINRLFLNDGSGRFAEASNAWPTDNQITRGGVLADIDGDGDLDALFAGAGSNRTGFSPVGFLRVLLNDGGGTFTDLTQNQPALPSLFTDKLVAGDVDGDGSPDLVIQQFDRTWLLLNDGTGSFVERPDLLPPGNLGSDLLLADLDEDGRAELLAATPNALTLYDFVPGTGFRALPPDALPSIPPSSLPVPPIARLVATDLDEDGDQDLVVSTLALLGPIRQSIWFGLRRQLEAFEDPRSGRPFRFDLTINDGVDRGPRIALPGVSLGRARFPISGIGVVGIDLGASAPLSAVLLGFGQSTAGTTFQIPPEAPFVGLDLYFQALVVGGTGTSLVTNVWPARIGL